MTARHKLLQCAFVALCLCAGCASAPQYTLQTVHPSSEFLASDASLFSDGLDMAGDTAALGGRWAQDYADALSQRIDRADLIALATVTTLRTDVTPEQRRTHWLVVKLDKRFKGMFSDELPLAVTEGAPGFESVARSRDELLHQQFMLFTKWQQEQDEAPVRARWHLSRATPELIQTVRGQLGLLPAPTHKIIEHTRH
jgi:hypothetical protein